MHLADNATLIPQTVAELAGMLRDASDQGVSLRVGRPRRPHSGAVLSLERLTEPIEHYAGDLVARVAAGASLTAVNERLRPGGQWLPLDPAGSDTTTIGSIVASNDSGPRRHRFGTPRDLIIGIELALADGRLAKAGGRVVKNVAGYDLARLMCGSFGTLAVVTSATFKLFPVAPASRTVIVECGSVETLGRMTRAIGRAAPLTPSAVELEWPTCRLLIRFESTPRAAERLATEAADLCLREAGPSTSASIVADAEEAQLWNRYEKSIWDGPGTLLKLAVLPAHVPDVLNDLDQRARSHSMECRVGGRAALGVLYVRLANNVDRHPAAIADLRRATSARGGHLVVCRTDATEDIDGAAATLSADLRWGDVGDAVPLMQAVKARFDPRGILNPGRGPGGL